MPDKSVPEQQRQNGPDDVELSILMPCLNEAETLQTCITKAQAFLHTSHVKGEVVVGDNGSTDESQDIARKCGARVVDVPLRGYGAALYFAAQAARGRFIIMGDSDNSYDFANLTPFVAKLREGFALVMGNRFLGGIEPGAMPWKNRYIGNPILSGIGRLLFRCPAKDFHCGIRGFSAAAFKLMDLRTTGMEFASEMVIKATMMGLKIAEVPTTLSPDGRSRPPHLRPWRDGWRHLRFMLLYSPRWLFLFPGLFLMLLGMGLMVALSGGRVLLGTVSFDVHTLIYAAGAILIGYQSVMFAVFSKIFAINEGLLPADTRLDKVFTVFRLETGIICGTLLLGAGAALTAAAVRQWQLHAFGEIDPEMVLRQVVPAVLALALGSQTILSSFFISVLGLKIRRLEPRRDPGDED